MKPVSDVLTPKLRRTYTGRMIDPMNPDPALICKEDIAHHLALLCRYGGSTRRFYSVAEHCCLGLEFVSAGNEFAFLMHDAAEYLLGDVIAPVKYLDAMKPYRATENYVWGIIAAKFGLPKKLPAEIHAIDMRMRVTEMRDLMGRAPNRARDEVDPLPVLISTQPCYEAEQMFLDAFEKYGPKG